MAIERFYDKNGKEHIRFTACPACGKPMEPKQVWTSHWLHHCPGNPIRAEPGEAWHVAAPDEAALAAVSADD